ASDARARMKTARLYEAQRREADHLKALLEFTGAISEAETLQDIARETVTAASRLLSKSCALRLPGAGHNFRVASHSDHDGVSELRSVMDVTLDGAHVRKAIGGR